MADCFFNQPPQAKTRKFTCCLDKITALLYSICKYKIPLALKQGQKGIKIYQAAYKCTRQSTVFSLTGYPGFTEYLFQILFYYIRRFSVHVHRRFIFISIFLRLYEKSQKQLHKNPFVSGHLLFLFFKLISVSPDILDNIAPKFFSNGVYTAFNAMIIAHDIFSGNRLINLSGSQHLVMVVGKCV